ncbi:hypothetical protein M104_5075 [Bacteroides fragilis str. 1007-1-F |uniref:Uncharacterized protein n=2 Tax=Bacteroides fragilis TaxID=817 RepID=A0AAN4MWC8_BACFG|nr:hypothetical protein M120_5170 [Bacteroides fragilis str. 3783N1-8]EYA11915.1 hypothetical protein M104_5075 [Bacteroides fragilis str. 1007-1-F \
MFHTQEKHYGKYTHYSAKRQAFKHQFSGFLYKITKNIQKSQESYTCISVYILYG